MPIERPTQSSSARQLRVLLVEDDMFDYQAVKRYLRGAPHIELCHVESLVGAMTLIREESFDCFLLDWYLPDGEGEDFLTFSLDMVPWVPTIVMTSGINSALIEKALALGAQDYISKGAFSSEELQRSITYAIARKRAELQRWGKLQNERMSFVNRIVAGVAHEINNPIAWISSNIGMLQMRFAQQEIEPDEVLELCQECAQGVDRIASVVKVLRTYAESIDKRLELKDLVALTTRCVKDVSALKSWHVEGCIVSVQSLPQVQLDQKAIYKALYQIVLNGFQAAEANATPEHPGRVEVCLALFERRIVLDIHDSGQGMEAQIAEHVFEPFYSSQRATNLGMGLAIAHDVILSHRGDIEVKETSPLGGAWIQVRLPVL